MSRKENFNNLLNRIKLSGKCRNFFLIKTREREKKFK